MNTQNIRCKFILSFTTINCTQIYNKMLKFTKTEAHTHRAGTAPSAVGRNADRRGAAAWSHLWRGTVPARHGRRLLLMPCWARVFWGSTYKRPGRPVTSEWAVCLSSKLILVVRGDLSCLHAFFIVLRATPWTFNHTIRRATSDAGRAP